MPLIVKASILSFVWSRVKREIKASLSSFLILRMLFVVSYNNWLAYVVEGADVPEFVDPNACNAEFKSERNDANP